MHDAFILDRGTLIDAADLLRDFGDDAGLEAAVRAEASRDRGNIMRFCHWRQIERVIAVLASDEATGTVH